MSGLQLQQVFSLHIFWPPENPDYIFISKTIDLAAIQRIRKERSEYLLNDTIQVCEKLSQQSLTWKKALSVLNFFKD